MKKATSPVAWARVLTRGALRALARARLSHGRVNAAVGTRGNLGLAPLRTPRACTSVSQEAQPRVSSHATTWGRHRHALRARARRSHKKLNPALGASEREESNSVPYVTAPLLLWAKRACPLVSRQLSDYVLKRGMEAFRLSETFPTTAKSAIKESMAQLCFRRTTQISPWTIPMNVSVARPFDAGLSMALSRNDV